MHTQMSIDRKMAHKDLSYFIIDTMKTYSLWKYVSAVELTVVILLRVSIHSYATYIMFDTEDLCPLVSFHPT